MLRVRADSIPCPECGARAGARCVNADGRHQRAAHTLRSAIAARDLGERLSEPYCVALERAGLDARRPRDRVAGLAIARTWAALEGVPWSPDRLRCALAAELASYATDTARAASSEQLLALLALVLLLRSLELSAAHAADLRRAAFRATREHLSLGAGLMRAITWGR